MLQNIQLINARLIGFKELQQIGIDRHGRIEHISTMSTVPASKRTEGFMDLKGDFVSLGGVDLQINGALGLAFPDLDRRHIPKLNEICQFLWRTGIDAFLPTLVTTSPENIQRSLEVIEDFMAIQSGTPGESAKVLGAHLEGPFLNHEKRGAHPDKYLLIPTQETVQWLLGDHASAVKLVTLAPELDPTSEVVSFLKSQGIRVSIGHSQATAEEAAQAFARGATLVTHAFNAMPPLHHRKPGLLGEAMLNPQILCGLIADGQHVSPKMIDVLLRVSGYEKGVFLVSDALSPLGLGDGIYPWDDRQIEVKDGTARLPNGTLAGTTLPLLSGAQQLVKWGICPVESAIAMVTDSPRQAIGLPLLSAGQPAQLLRWHWDKSKRALTWQRLTADTEFNL
jgi:N-acetylglucosamine-6-phosphate deacetylase